MLTPDKSQRIVRIHESFHKLGRFSENDLRILTLHLNAVSVPKDYSLVNEGKVCQSIYFIDQGSFRQYHITDTGEEITQNLFLEDDWVLDYKSFTSQQPSASVIEAMEDSQLLELSIYNLHALIKTSDVFFQVARIFQFGMVQNDRHLNNETPKEKYIHLLNHKPQIIQRFPLKYIASYLGMTPETLSRVRRSLTASIN